MQAFKNSGSRSQFLNLGRVLRQTTLVNPDGIALACGDEHLSFEELDRSTDARALALADWSGVRRSRCNSLVQLYRGGSALLCVLQGRTDRRPFEQPSEGPGDCLHS